MYMYFYLSDIHIQCVPVPECMTFVEAFAETRTSIISSNFDISITLLEFTLHPASSNAVIPRSSCALTFAPASTNVFTTSEWLFFAAWCKGVLPQHSGTGSCGNQKIRRYIPPPFPRPRLLGFDFYHRASTTRHIDSFTRSRRHIVIAFEDYSFFLFTFFLLFSLPCILNSQHSQPIPLHDPPAIPGLLILSVEKKKCRRSEIYEARTLLIPPKEKRNI